MGAQLHMGTKVLTDHFICFAITCYTYPWRLAMSGDVESLFFAGLGLRL